jgi:hypothetical protein
MKTRKLLLAMLFFLIGTAALTACKREVPENRLSELDPEKSINFILPFRIDVDPMERLLLINFEKDPDSLYLGFETQVFNDAINGSGHLVIGWRMDGKVDVYHQPGLKLDPEKYDIAGKGLANMVEREMKDAFYEINESGVQASYAFNDIHDRTVTLRINESHPKKRKPFGLLAPMGSVAENPSAMPLVLLHDFYFVRKKHTEALVSIAGKAHQPDELPVPMDGRKMYFMRYSPKPLIATLNPAFEGELQELRVTEGSMQMVSGHHIIELDWNNDIPVIKSVTRENETFPVQLRFEPGFPNVADLPDNYSTNGRFEIEAHPSTGRITGIYSIEKIEKEILVKMIPSGGWKPRPTKLSLRFMYRVVKTFRQWPTTYKWTAKITEVSESNYQMVSAWQRIE